MLLRLNYPQKPRGRLPAGSPITEMVAQERKTNSPNFSIITKASPSVNCSAAGEFYRYESLDAIVIRDGKRPRTLRAPLDSLDGLLVAGVAQAAVSNDPYVVHSGLVVAASHGSQGIGETVICVPWASAAILDPQILGVPQQPENCPVLAIRSGANAGRTLYVEVPQQDNRVFSG